MNNKRNILHLMFVLVAQLRRDFKEFLIDYDLTEMEAKFILFIGEGFNETAQLIERFKKHKSTIRQKTRSLEEKGYVTTTSGTVDKRERIVVLTDKGNSFYTEMKKAELEYHNQVFKNFSQKDQKELVKLLGKIEITQNYDYDVC